jgi:Tol biopolymer transport system component
MNRLGRTAVTTIFGGLACALCAADVGPGLATRVSLGNGDAEGNSGAYEGAIANNGQIVAFYSDSTNVVPGVDGSNYQIFVRDRRTGAVDIVSTDFNGVEGNDGSYFPCLSANGRIVVYYTDASNIAPDNLVGGSQAMAYDRVTGDAVQVSASPFAEASDGSTDLYDCRPLSANGRFVVFASSSSNLVEDDTNGFSDIFLRDLAKRTTTRLTLGTAGEANGNSYYPSISPNGRWVVFSSDASNLIAGDVNIKSDIFLRDLKTGTTEIVSLADDESVADGDSEFTGSAVSNNGRWVVFLSAATNLVSGDTNGFRDVFLRDRKERTTKRISVGPGPGFAQGDNNAGTPAITPNGKLVTYWTYASNMIDAADTMSYDTILYDVNTGMSRRVLEALAGGESGGNGNYAYWNQMSANGRWFCDASNSGNIEAGDGNADWDVYLVDLK